MSFSALLSRLPPDLRLMLADVGSAGGLAPRWRAVAPIVSALRFDPREGGTVRIIGSDHIYPVGLAAAPGTAMLNITALGNMSSTLVPNTVLFDRFTKKRDHVRIVNTQPVPVDSLDNVARHAGVRVDALKVDTQGSEHAVLAGAHHTLSKDTLFVEVEVSFIERYCGQPLLDTLWDALRGYGFELIDLHRLKRYRHVNRAGIGNISLGGGQRAGRLAYGDAWFMLSDDALAVRLAAASADAAPQIAMKAMLLLLVYGKPDMAARLFDRNRELLPPALRAAWSTMFQRLARRRYGLQNMHRVLELLARKI